VRRLGLYLVLAACSAKPRDPATVIYTLEAAPDVQVHPDAEILVGVIGDVGDRLDVRAQLVAQLERRVPDLIVLPTAGLATATPQPLGADGLDYAYAHVAKLRDGSIVVEYAKQGGSRIVIDPAELGGLDGAALVRVRKHTLSIDLFGADGVALR